MTSGADGRGTKHEAAVADVPLVDLRDADAGSAIDHACRQHGFFVIVGHGVDRTLVDDLESAARRVFALPTAEKERDAMARNGRAWRGWFPLDGELTSGRPDHKEGWYFGTDDDPADGRPMHGANVYPSSVPELADLVPRYLNALTILGRRIVGLMDDALDVGGRLYALVDDPLVLFRLFGYPPAAPAEPGEPAAAAERWGVGEHTDYGLLTILHQDRSGGLEVRTTTGWHAVEPVEGAFVCNIGDMLDTATGGAYRSTPHRVRNTSGTCRISMPFFLDPGWDAHVERLTGRVDRSATGSVPVDRWDGEDPHLFSGPYGDYVWSKVGKVFPDLR